MRVIGFPPAVAPQASAQKKARFQGALNGPAADGFVRSAVRFGQSDSVSPVAAKPLDTARTVDVDPNHNLVKTIYDLGAPGAKSRDEVGFRISRFFAPDKRTIQLNAFLAAKDDETAQELMFDFLNDPRYRKAYVFKGPHADVKKMLPKVRRIAQEELAERIETHLDSTYGQLFDNMSRMAAGFRKEGLGAGKRIAIAETNSLEYLATYYGALAAGATAVPINLLALTSDSERMDNLMHMINGPESDAYVFGADKGFKPMYAFQKILLLKKPRGGATRYAESMPPQTMLDHVRFELWDDELKPRVETKVQDLLEARKVAAAEKQAKTRVKQPEPVVTQKEIEAIWKAFRREKARPFLEKATQRFVNGEAPRNALERLFFAKLEKSVEETAARKIAALKAANLQKVYGTGKPAAEITDAQIEMIRQQSRADFKTLFEKLPAQLKLITPEATAKMRRLAPMHPSRLLLQPDPSSFADIIYTSGTSGMPKGVGLTHGNQSFMVSSLSKAIEGMLKPDDVMLLGLPLFHIFGKAVALTALKHQTQMVMIPSLRDAVADLDGTVNTIQEYKVSVLPAVPLVLEKLMAHVAKHPEAADKLKGIRFVISGGAALKKETYDALKKINPDMVIMEGYGSTEAGIVSLNKSGEPGVIGHALPGVEVKLTEANEEHGMYGYTTWFGPGEIQVKSPGVAQYVEGTVPETQPTNLKDDKGYFHTGDIAARLPERNHALQVKDRIANFHKDRGGERRPQTQYEAAVKGADPRVADAMGITYKPSREVEKMVVVAVSPDKGVTEDSLRAAMSAQVDSGKLTGLLVPEHVIVLHRESLPEAFKNEFKREAGYKAVKKFVEEALKAGVIRLEDRGNGNAWWKTVVPDQAALEKFAEEFRYTGGKK